MKKIMFNDKYGLTDAVLNGLKTMTRRVIDSKDVTPMVTSDRVLHHVEKGFGSYHEYTDDAGKVWLAWSPFKIGEEVAVAQSYRTLIELVFLCDERKDGWVREEYVTSPGYRNKMFVRADFMPHRIRITDIKLERLKDISSEDCISEGIEARIVGCHTFYFHHGVEKPFEFPRQAFAALIDKVSGKGTWDSNPLAFVYSFKLIQ